MKKVNILLEMLVAMIVWGILVQIIFLIIGEQHLYNAIGIWAGVAISFGLAVHMKLSIEKSFDMGEGQVKKYMIGAYTKRLCTAGVIVALILFYDLGNALALLIGLFALKVSAYVQPLVHKLFEKKGGQICE